MACLRAGGGGAGLSLGEGWCATTGAAQHACVQLPWCESSDGQRLVVQGGQRQADRICPLSAASRCPRLTTSGRRSLAFAPGPPRPAQAEFKSAAQDFVQQRTEFDAEKLREQVVETLRVSPSSLSFNLSSQQTCPWHGLQLAPDNAWAFQRCRLLPSAAACCTFRADGTALLPCCPAEQANKVMDWLTNNCKVTVVPATQP